MEKPQNHFEVPQWLRRILAYGVAVVGILVLPCLVALVLKSWVIGLLLFVIVIPLFPAIQSVLLKKKPVNLLMFLKIYGAEFALLSLQLGFLLVSAPIIAIMAAGRLVIALLAAAVIAWFIIGLQQLGLDIGAKMAKNDIIILLWVTIGLVVGVGIFYFFHRLVKKHEDSFFSLWARQFKKIREYFRYETLSEEDNGE